MRIYMFAVLVVSVSFIFSCSSESSHILRGHSLFDRGEYADSVNFYSRAIEEKPNIASSYYYRGLAWLMEENYELAIIDFTQAIELDNNYLYAYINRGSIWKEKAEYEKSLSDYNIVVYLDPEDLRSLKHRADLLFLTKQFSRAIIDYDILINKEYEVSDTYRARADAKYFELDYEGAIDDYSKSIMLDSKIPYAYNNLSWLQATCVNGNFRDGEKAVYNAKKAVDIYGNKYTLHTLAVAYAELGIFDRSVSLLNEIIKKYDWSEMEMVLLERLLMEIGENRSVRRLPSDSIVIRDDSMIEF